MNEFGQPATLLAGTVSAAASRKPVRYDRRREPRLPDCRPGLETQSGGRSRLRNLLPALSLFRWADRGSALRQG